MKSTSLLLTRVLYCSLLLKKSTFIPFILSLSLCLSLSQTNPHWLICSGVLVIWCKVVELFSWSDSVFLLPQESSNPDRHASQVGGGVGWFVWFGLIFVRLVLCLFWVSDYLWEFWLLWILSSLLPTSGLLYGVCLCDFGKRKYNIYMKLKWSIKANVVMYE